MLRAAAAADLRERAYQIFGAEFLDNLLEVAGGHPQLRASVATFRRRVIAVRRAMRNTCS